MAAGAPLLLITFLGIVIQIGWMFGRKIGRRWRVAIGGFLIAGFFVSLIVIGLSGVFSKIGGLSFMVAWCFTFAMYLVPILENISKWMIGSRIKQ